MKPGQRRQRQRQRQRQRHRQRPVRQQRRHLLIIPGEKLISGYTRVGLKLSSTDFSGAGRALP